MDYFLNEDQIMIKYSRQADSGGEGCSCKRRA